MASGIVLLSQEFWLVAASQVATAIAGAAIGPAVAGITLGIVHQAGFNRQNGRNQAFNHAGNMVGAGLSGLVGWLYGFTAVFWLAALFGALSIASVLMIPRAIPSTTTRLVDWCSRPMTTSAQAVLRVLVETRPLLVLAAASALLSSRQRGDVVALWSRRVAGKQADPASFVALAHRGDRPGHHDPDRARRAAMAEKEGYWLVLLVSFVALPSGVSSRRGCST